MKRPRVIRPVVAIAIALLFLTSSGTARAGDSLASREVIASDLSQPVSGSTVAKTVEPGEINEAGGPADAQDRSVWYEWTPAQTGTALWGMASNAPVRGVAAYTLANAGAPVTMENLVPAGAVVLPREKRDRGMQLWVTAGQKMILRVWTVGDPASSFNLTLSFNPAAVRRAGDLPSTAILLPVYNPSPGGSEAFYGKGYFQQDDGFTMEAEDTEIGGARYPGGAAYWYRWHTGRAGAMRFSLTENAFKYGTVLVAEQPSPGGALNLVAGPGKSVTFTPVPDREYLVRVAFTPSTSEFSSFELLTLVAGPAEAGDEPAGAKPLAPGGSAAVNLMGASPTQLPLQSDNHIGYPDVWFDLGSNLSGPFIFKVDGPFDGSIYLADPVGNPLTILAGEGWDQDLSFLAEAGRHYMARVKSRALLIPAGTVSLSALTTPPPANDRRAGAELLPADGPVLLYGNATGATVEESDRINSNYGVRGRTVWYALDRPASAQPWFAGVVCSGESGVSIFREENGTLVNAWTTSWSRFNLTGSRVWIMVSVNYDAHFILMTGPAVSQGADLSDPVPLVPGETRFLLAPVHDPNLNWESTQWLSWTAPQSGPVVFSTLGTNSGGQMNSYIYTAALEPVALIPGLPFDHSGPGEVLSFDAVAGTSYRFALCGFRLSQVVVVVRLQAGGWESPYDLWVQGYPAWKDDASLTDPLADADGDGNVNLIEMACAGNVLKRNPRGFPLEITADSVGSSMSFTERTWPLQGAAGSRPFSLIFESSSSLTAWAEVEHSVETVGASKNHYWTMQPPAGNSPAARFYRLRVSR